MMKTSPLTTGNFIELMTKRYATKIFDGTTLDKEVLSSLVESLNLTPTSMGLQPIRLSLISDPNIKSELLKYSYNQPQITSCSHLFVLSKITNLDYNYVQNYIENISKTREVELESLDKFKSSILNWMNKDINSWLDNQAYILLGNLVTSCAMLGIDSCPIEGFIKESYDSVLNLKSLNLKSVIICAVGISSDECPRKFENKVRLPLKDFIVGELL